MVTSRIPTYSLNTEFNREFRSFRVSSSSHIVPVHEFSRISLQERRAALRAAFAKDSAPERPRPAEARPLFFRCDSLQERRAALQAAFERNAEKARFDAKVVKKQESGGDTKLDNRVTARKEIVIPQSKFESRDKIFAKVETVIETRGDLRNDDRNSTVLSVRSNFKKFPIREPKPEIRSILAERLINKLENKFDGRYQTYDKRPILATESLTDIRSNMKKDSLKLPKIDYRTVSGAESLKDLCSDLKAELRKLKRPEYKIGVAGSMNDVRNQRFEEHKMSKSRVLTTEEPNMEGWSTPDSGVALGDSPPEDRRGKNSDLPAMYLSLSSWTPKSSVFQNRLKEHEWSISSSEHEWRRRRDRSKRSHRRSPTSNRRRRNRHRSGSRERRHAEERSQQQQDAQQPATIKS